MNEQSVESEDMNLKRVFQDFYRVPEYQREYVWGEANADTNRRDEVEQFLNDIHQEFENSAQPSSQYFIGSFVVCPSEDELYDLIDGQQRTTTAFLTLCALRDRFQELQSDTPDDLPGQILSSSTDWKGDTARRTRLELQYDDSRGVLEKYARSEWKDVEQAGTRSISNLASAYNTIRNFLITQFGDDPKALRRFYGYFVNKVTLIRIKTATVAKALKIFETINDRGVGLDAMDLLKNLLFMNVPAKEFVELKDIWKAITDLIYAAQEKPLRFLRYFLLAEYSVDTKLQEATIYEWFKSNSSLTKHARDPIGFASKLRKAAEAYANAVNGCNPQGVEEPGIVNTRHLGGSAVRQHFILLLAGRALAPPLFARLAKQIEELMFVFLITSTPTN